MFQLGLVLAVAHRGNGLLKSEWGQQLPVTELAFTYSHGKVQEVMWVA